MPKEKAVGRPHGVHRVKRHACSRGYRGHGVVPPNRLLLSVVERNIIDVTKSENSSKKIFLFVMSIMLCAQRSRKRTIISSFKLRRRSFLNVEIMFFFTFELVEHSSMEKRRRRKNNAKSGHFPRLLLPLVHL